MADVALQALTEFAQLERIGLPRRGLVVCAPAQVQVLDQYANDRWWLRLP